MNDPFAQNYILNYISGRILTFWFIINYASLAFNSKVITTFSILVMSALNSSFWTLISSSILATVSSSAFSVSLLCS